MEASPPPPAVPQHPQIKKEEKPKSAPLPALIPEPAAVPTIVSKPEPEIKAEPAKTELKITIKQLQPPFSTLVEKTEAAPAKKPEVVPAKKPETAEKAVELAPKPVKKPKKHWDDEDDDVAAFVQLHKRTPAQNGQNS